MTREVLLAVAALVSFGGVVVVVAGARGLQGLDPRRGVVAAVALIAAFGAAMVLRPPVGLASNIAVLGGATGAAMLLSRPLGSRASVLAFLITAALVDLFSFSEGLTRAIVEAYREGRSPVLLYLTLVVRDAGRPIPVVGIGDLVVGGAAAVALLAVGVRAMLVTAGLGASLFAALVIGIWRGGAAAVPFLAGAFALVVWWQARIDARAGPQG
jgi:hypothetical protein